MIKTHVLKLCLTFIFNQYQSIENINIFAGDILAINNLLTKS